MVGLSGTSSHWNSAIDSQGGEKYDKTFQKSFFDITIDAIDENGNIEITLTECKDSMFQGFIAKATRKRFRRLHEIAAFNLAQHLVSETDVESLNIPKTLIHLVKKILVTYSASYVIDRRITEIKLPLKLEPL